MAFPNVFVVRIIVGISMLSAIIMMVISSILLGARVEDLRSSKFPSSGVPSNISDSTTHLSGKEQEAYTSTLRSLNDLWVKNRPVLVSSSVLAILAGMLQVIFSGLVLLSDSKAVRLYLRKWVTVHFILVFILFIIILNTVILSEDETDKKLWEYLTSSLRKYLKVERPSNNYDELFRFLGAGPHLIYICVGTNLGIILVLMALMLYLMRKEPGDYESCD